MLLTEFDEKAYIEGVKKKAKEKVEKKAEKKAEKKEETR